MKSQIEFKCYIESFRIKYHRQKMGEKSRLLDKFFSVAGLDRKFSIKLLSKKKGVK